MTRQIREARLKEIGWSGLKADWYELVSDKDVQIKMLGTETWRVRCYRDGKWGDWTPSHPSGFSSVEEALAAIDDGLVAG